MTSCKGSAFFVVATLFFSRLRVERVFSDVESREVVYVVVLRFAFVFSTDRIGIMDDISGELRNSGSLSPERRDQGTSTLAKFPWRELMRSSEPEVDNESVNVKKLRRLLLRAGRSARSFLYVIKDKRAALEKKKYIMRMSDESNVHENLTVRAEYPQRNWAEMWQL